ncbi:zinc-binding dehydrogenase [Nocardia sp. NPDC047038]|uniref:zinc-binding dehydrogenase n=1 Tax=Nocardia sp. NPDC047038 TaxID=3154338 RepID=UPI0033E261AB
MTSNSSASASPETMKGLVQKSFNGPDDLVMVTDLPVPSPGPHDYLIKVGAAGLNFADVMQTRGTYAGGPVPEYVAGFEAAGEIVAVGCEIADPLPIGSHIIGAGPGAFAQYMVMPSVTVAPVPPGWSDAASLGLVLNWATALAAIKPLGNLASGEWVLVHAAAGGVGQAAIRLARHYGAKVVATASQHKHKVLAGLGADVVLDRERADLGAEIRRLTGGVDLVLESVGKATFSTSLSVAKPFMGRIVVFGAASGDASISTHELVFEHRVQVKGLHVGAFAELVPELYVDLLEELSSLIELGVYTPGNPDVHSIADGPAAMRALAGGGTVGKLAIDPWS